MNQKTLLVFASAAAAIAAAVFLWGSNQSQDVILPPDVIEHSERRHPVAAATPDRPIVPVSVNRSAPTLERMSLLSELSVAALSATESRGQLLMELGQAIQLCANLRVRLEHPSKRDLEQRAQGRTNTSIEASRRFCDDQQATLDVVTKEQLNLGAGDEVAQALGLRAMAIDKPNQEAVPLAERLVATGKDPLAVEAAADMLFGLDRDLPQTKAVPIPAALKYREAQIDAQRLALEMYTCSVRGGCGPGGLYTLLRCQKCGTGVHSLTDMWSQEYPQEVVTYARTLSNYMVAQRP